MSWIHRMRRTRALKLIAQFFFVVSIQWGKSRFKWKVLNRCLRSDTKLSFETLINLTLFKFQPPNQLVQHAVESSDERKIAIPISKYIAHNRFPVLINFSNSTIFAARKHFFYSTSLRFLHIKFIDMSITYSPFEIAQRWISLLKRNRKILHTQKTIRRFNESCFFLRAGKVRKQIPKRIFQFYTNAFKAA